jgi:hypothetical protein
LISHTLEYAYSLPTPTPASLTLVAIGNSVSPLNPWFLNTQAIPALDAVKVKDEINVVAAPGVGNLFNLGDIFNTVARTGISPYFFLDRARSLVLPLARAGSSAPPLAATSPTAPSSPATRTEAAARMKEKALPATTTSQAEGTATTPPTLQCLLGRRVAAVDRRPGIRAGSWNPTALGLPSTEVLNVALGGGSFYSPDEGESSSN